MAASSSSAAADPPFGRRFDAAHADWRRILASRTLLEMTPWLARHRRPRLAQELDMFRDLGLIAVGASIAASVGCGLAGPDSPLPSPPPPPPPLEMVAVQFEGRVVNDDTGGPVANVQASL